MDRLPRLYAHRLGRHYGPDSSLAALAGTLGGPGSVAGLETDVCLTSDGGLALLHDPLLTLGTTLEGWAHHRTADEIRASRIRRADGEPTDRAPAAARGAPAAGARRTWASRSRSSPTPTPPWRAGPPRRSSRPSTGHPLRDRAEVISFHPSACAVAALGGLHSRLVIWASYAPEALAAWALETGVMGVSVEHFLLSDELVGTLRDAGLSINTGTINRPELLARALEFHPDAIGTDRPHELLAEFTRERMPLTARATA